MNQRKRELDFSTWLLPLPDETLFSWCSRYHRLTANALDKWTCLQLFGHPRQGSAHDIPAHLNVLVQRMEGCLGQVADIIHDRTILPFYLAFKDRHVAAHTIDSACGMGVGSLKYRLGMLTSGLGAAHPLKVCPSCLQLAKAETGWSYWLRAHQIPGVWVCQIHRVVLHSSSWKSQPAHRFSWGLPSFVPCEPLASLEQSNDRAIGWMTRLANTCLSVLDQPASMFDDPHRIALAFRQRMQQMGFATRSGRILWTDLRHMLGGLIPDIRVIPELAHQASDDLLVVQMSRLLSGRALSHPLRYTVWITICFDDLANFSLAYKQIQSLDMFPDQVISREPPTVSKVNKRQQAELLLEQGHMSAGAIARQLGVAHQTVVAWGATVNGVIRRRPKKIDDQQWQSICSMLREGRDKAMVSQIHEVAVSTVTRVLRSVPNLQQEWHLVRFELARVKARQSFMEISVLLGSLGVKAIRRMVPGAYAWLYRNDRQWLSDQCDKYRLRAANYSSQRIENADRSLSSTVCKVAVDIATRSGHLTFAQLKQVVPALGKVTQDPSSWPQTVFALGEIFNARQSKDLRLWLE